MDPCSEYHLRLSATTTVDSDESDLGFLEPYSDVLCGRGGVKFDLTQRRQVAKIWDLGVVGGCALWVESVLGGYFLNHRGTETRRRIFLRCFFRTLGVVGGFAWRGGMERGF